MAKEILECGQGDTFGSQRESLEKLRNEKHMVLSFPKVETSYGFAGPEPVSCVINAKKFEFNWGESYRVPKTVVQLLLDAGKLENVVIESEGF